MQIQPFISVERAQGLNLRGLVVTVQFLGKKKRISQHWRRIIQKGRVVHTTQLLILVFAASFGDAIPYFFHFFYIKD